MMPNFSGIWKANLEKSNILGPPPTEFLVDLVHTEPHIRQHVIAKYANGTTRELTFECDTTGVESNVDVGGVAAKAKASWIGETLIVQTTIPRQDRDAHFRDHWSLSEDGHTLTMAHLDDDLAGQIAILDLVSP